MASRPRRKATHETGTSITRRLPPSCQQEIDRVAMAHGLFESDDYLEGWSWSDPLEGDGSTGAVAEAVAAESADDGRRARRRPR